MSTPTSPESVPSSRLGFGRAPRISIAPVSHPDLQSYPPAILNFYEKNRQASLKYEADLPVRKEWLQKRRFRPAANLCIDERVQDFPCAVGLPMGILEVYRAGGAKSDLGSGFYAKRRLDAIRKLRSVDISGESHQMVEMALFTAHYSESQPATASCTAWSHRTDDALVHMVQQSNELNSAFPGRAIGIPVLVDTDLDAITVVGPQGGRLSVRELLDDPAMQNGTVQEVLAERLLGVFPYGWGPLGKLDAAFQQSFHFELAERLVSNLRFVREVRDSHRPIELLDHNGRIVFVGRHADWIEDHNTTFLIDDTEERAKVQDYFALALTYVARNVVIDAIASDDRDWRVPVIVNVPHDEEDDYNLTIIYTRKLIQDLSATLHAKRKDLVHALIGPGHGIDRLRVPDWMFRQVHEELEDRVFFAGSVSYRKDRLFRSFV